MDLDWIRQFENRKQDHIRIALSSQSQTTGASGLEKIELIHEAIPAINFKDVDTSTSLFGKKLKFPYLVSSMTAGHGDAAALNYALAKACHQRGWALGVGSQRRELVDLENNQEWAQIRKDFPGLCLFGNLGITQLIKTPIAQIKNLAERMGAAGFFIHTNSLQEVLQGEGTPDFAGSWEALENLTRNLGLPVIIKEVGCGFSKNTLMRLCDSGVSAVDVSGRGGTHWGRVEGYRAGMESSQYIAAQTFKDWGHSTLASLMSAVEIAPPYQVWASGGVRTGLDAAKLLAVGAQMVGFAQPILAAALQGEAHLQKAMDTLELELKIALFCTGFGQLQGFRQGRVWQWT